MRNHPALPIVLFDKPAYDRRHSITREGKPMLQITRRSLEERRTRHSKSSKATPPRHGVFLEGSPQVPVYEEELWTSRQRQASSIHEVSYRACFKPQLPASVAERLSNEGVLVYDPFTRLGTTAV